MKAFVTLAETTISDGKRLSLHAHDGEYSLRVAGRQLMSTRATGSETQLADLACANLAQKGRSSVLIGGLLAGY